MCTLSVCTSCKKVMLLRLKIVRCGRKKIDAFSAIFFFTLCWNTEIRFVYGKSLAPFKLHGEPNPMTHLRDCKATNTAGKSECTWNYGLCVQIGPFAFCKFPISNDIIRCTKVKQYCIWTAITLHYYKITFQHYLLITYFSSNSAHIKGDSNRMARVSQLLNVTIHPVNLNISPGDEWLDRTMRKSQSVGK